MMYEDDDVTPPPPFELLKNDDAVVAIHKPAGVASIPGGNVLFAASKLVAAQLGLPSSGQSDPRIRPVHRIDQDTSGVLLFAKSRSAQQMISHQFQNNLVEKEYLAIVVGEPPGTSGEIDQPIARDGSDSTRRRVHRTGKPAITRWEIARHFRGYALLRVFPKTGKTHQIRVHLAHIGLPLAVDLLYNRSKPKNGPGLFLSAFKRGYRAKSDVDERPLILRLTLHARRLSLKHPDESPLDLIAEPPKDFRAALNQLTRHASA